MFLRCRRKIRCLKIFFKAFFPKKVSNHISTPVSWKLLNLASSDRKCYKVFKNVYFCYLNLTSSDVINQKVKYYKKKAIPKVMTHLKMQEAHYVFSLTLCCSYHQPWGHRRKIKFWSYPPVLCSFSVEKERKVEWIMMNIYSLRGNEMNVLERGRVKGL